MKTADQITSTIQQRAASGQPLHAQGQNVKRLNRPEIETLWQMMSSMYGHRWSSSYGADVDPDKVWHAALAGITPDQIKAGLRRAAQSGQEWPPSAPEFRVMCTGESDSGREWAAFESQAKETAERIASERLRLADHGARGRAEQSAAAEMQKIKNLLRGV